MVAAILEINYMEGLDEIVIRSTVAEQMFLSVPGNWTCFSEVNKDIDAIMELLLYQCKCLAIYKNQSLNWRAGLGWVTRPSVTMETRTTKLFETPGSYVLETLENQLQLKNKIKLKILTFDMVSK